MIIIKVEESPELRIVIDKMVDLLPYKAALKAGAMFLKGKLSKYPKSNRLTRASVYGQSFISDKQRSWFFAALAAGDLVVPYVRGSDKKSETLSKGWAIAEENDGLRLRIGNDTTYGAWVMGPGTQSRYMAAVGWQTTDQIVTENQNQLVQTMERTLDGEVRKLGGV